MIALLTISIGTGGLKPLIGAFGGDQYVRPQQDRELETFFSIFYFVINTGSFLSVFLTPILREDVQCFGQNTCFSLAFGVPAIMLVLGIGE